MRPSVFVSWSGQVSREFARFFAGWLQLAVPVRAFCSQDIEKGSRWNDEIMRQLRACRFGIVVVTRENLRSEWIHFEAGALSQAMGRSRSKATMTPLLLDVEPFELPSTLSQYQATRCTRQEMERLARAVCSVMPSEDAPTDDMLRKQLDAHWSEFEDHLTKARELATDLSLTRAGEEGKTERELLDEVRLEVGNLRQLNESLLRDFVSYRQSAIELTPEEYAEASYQLPPVARYRFSTQADASEFLMWLLQERPDAQTELSADGLGVEISNYQEVDQYDRLRIRDTATRDFDGERIDE